ncbi:SCO4225 family membrane protein [Streptomyces sp. NPDC087294]|uniref:SCO4225 family membrane protein n=1 Tax=Streptomyces sp. NPDC087294 TaxID=3365777 RepID=UPI00382AF4A7
MTDPTTRPRPTRRLRHLLTDGVALVYLGVCAALLIWTFAVTVFDDTGESMAGVIPMLATAPTSLVFLVLPDQAWSFVVAVVFGALVNATVIGWCSRTLRAGRASR